MDKINFNNLEKLYLEQSKTTRLALAISVLGLVFFLSIALILPFTKSLLFSKLYIKPFSRAADLVFPNTPIKSKTVFEGWVRKILATNTGAYLGGSITYAGDDTGQGVAISTASAQLVPNYPYIEGGVETAISDGLNGWYLGGNFTKVGSQTTTGLVHILADGSIDPNFNVTFNYINNPLLFSVAVKSLILSADKQTLYIGGTFDTVNNQTRNRLTAVKTSDGTVTDFNPNVTGVTTQGSSDWSEVYTMVLSPDNSILYIGGGSITNVGGQSRQNLAAVKTSDSTVTDFNPNPDYDVLTLAISSDGTKLYAGGYFDTIYGLTAPDQRRSRIAAIDTTTASGSAILSFKPPDPTVNPQSDVYTIVLSSDDKTLYMGGVFASLDGTNNHRLLTALDATDGSIIDSFNPAMPELNYVWTMDLSPDNLTLYIGGKFGSVGDQPRFNIASVKTADGSVTDWNPKATNLVSVIALNSDATIAFVGGVFASAGPSVLKMGNLARIQTDGTLDRSFLPKTFGTVWSMALSPDQSTLYIGGDFSTVNDQPRPALTSINTTDGSLTSFNPIITSRDYHPASVRTLSLSSNGSMLYMGGYFNTVGGQTRSNLAAVTTADASPSANLNLATDSLVYTTALTKDDSTLYVGGSFKTITDQNGIQTTRNRLAAVNTTDGSLTSFDPSITTTTPGYSGYADVKDMILSPNDAILYLGGQFDHIGDQLRMGIGAVATASALPTSFDPNVNDTYANSLIYGLALSPSGDTLYIAVSAISASSLKLAMDTASGLATSWNPTGISKSAVNTVSLSPNGNYIYFGGCFFSHFVIFGQQEATPTPTDNPSATLTPTPPLTPTPTNPPQNNSGGGQGSSDSGGGGGGGGSNPPPAVVVPINPPKTGHR